ncbi:unnamed protein product [Phytophthora fragariaefolia]|uniref:Unnamed protein product n=1 Tax=Phytophthora fragariaefolia TaxID=1490495 RepID=A0A9W6Y9X0_9STRA|nr:unnamed protein product [Phytophthora fragariaefolia]
MGLDELKPGNTKRAKDTAISAFMTFVKFEQVEFDYVKRCIEQDATGKCFVSALDMFGMYLAFNAGKKGKTLARNTAMQYSRQCQIWLFELFPVQQHIVEAKLLNMGKTLDNFCMKRDGKVVNKAPPCSKSDLKKMMSYLYKNASSSSDYQDAAERIVFLVALERNKWSHEEASERFGIPRTTLLGYIGANLFSTESDPWSRCVARPGIPPPKESSEALIVALVKQRDSTGIPLCRGEIIDESASVIPCLKGKSTSAQNSWLTRFIARHKLASHIR